MPNTNGFRVAVFAGDRSVQRSLSLRSLFRAGWPVEQACLTPFSLEGLPAGAAHFVATGEALPAATLAAARAADAIFCSVQWAIPQSAIQMEPRSHHS